MAGYAPYLFQIGSQGTSLGTNSINRAFDRAQQGEQFRMQVEEQRANRRAQIKQQKKQQAQQKKLFHQQLATNIALDFVPAIVGGVSGGIENTGLVQPSTATEGLSNVNAELISPDAGTTLTDLGANAGPPAGFSGVGSMTSGAFQPTEFQPTPGTTSVVSPAPSPAPVGGAGLVPPEAQAGFAQRNAYLNSQPPVAGNGSNLPTVDSGAYGNNLGSFQGTSRLPNGAISEAPGTNPNYAPPMNPSGTGGLPEQTRFAFGNTRGESIAKGALYGLASRFAPGLTELPALNPIAASNLALQYGRFGLDVARTNQGIATAKAHEAYYNRGGSRGNAAGRTSTFRNDLTQQVEEGIISQDEANKRWNQYTGHIATGRTSSSGPSAAALGQVVNNPEAMSQYDADQADQLRTQYNTSLGLPPSQSGFDDVRGRVLYSLKQGNPDDAEKHIGYYSGKGGGNTIDAKQAEWLRKKVQAYRARRN